MARLAGWRRRAKEPPPPDEHEQEIVRALGRLRDTTAREVMTPRVDVVALPLPVSAPDVARAVKESGHSRFPVYEESLDRLAGILFVKDLFRMGGQPSAEEIARRLREPHLVPESQRVLEVLQDMRHRRRAFAIVVDEYGGVEGVLTIKDLVAELVGDLVDEFDREEAEISRVDSHRWLVDGHTPVDRLVEELGVPIPEGDYVTVGGFLFAVTGRIPDEGDSVEHTGWELKVTEMDRRRIAKVVIREPAAASGNLLDPTGK